MRIHKRFAIHVKDENHQTYLLRYLKEIFPNSKFLLMIRDGRATAHSIISRKITISEFNLKSYRLVCNFCSGDGIMTIALHHLEMLMLKLKMYSLIQGLKGQTKQVHLFLS